MRDLMPAITAGCAYLLGRQHADGGWEDYDLPTGSSDAWVTAYVGVALMDVARFGLDSRAADAGRRGATWLSRNRASSAGWGYNAATGPDAHSTGYALRLLRAAGGGHRPEDEAWLLAHWRPNRGFATYDGPDGWGLAHPDVTPVAFAALSGAAQDRLRAELSGALSASRDADGTWPAYWWRTRHYSTYVNNRLAESLGLDLRPVAPVVTLAPDRAVYSAFDLAFVTANAALHNPSGEVCSELAESLLAFQAPDGYWPGAANMRVTRHDAPDPWNNPEGALYVDIDHLITTASALHVLAELHALWTRRR